MKQNFWTTLVTTGAIALSSVILSNQPSHGQQAPNDSRFYCGMTADGPTTLYQNRQGKIEPWIVWTSDYFAGSGYTPMERCQEVSLRLQNYLRNKQLDFMTTGQINNQNVICTASQVGGSCQNLIFTLRAGQDPIRTLNNLLAWRKGQAATPSLFESAGGPQTVPSVPYIDLRDRLGGDGGGTSAPMPIPNNTRPVTPQPSGNPGGMREL